MTLNQLVGGEKGNAKCPLSTTRTTAHIANPSGAKSPPDPGALPRNTWKVSGLKFSNRSEFFLCWSPTLFPVLQRGGGACGIPVRAAGSTVLISVVDVQVPEMSELDEIIRRQIRLLIIRNDPAATASPTCLIGERCCCLNGGHRCPF